MRSVEELFQSDESLLPELEPYVVETAIGQWVKHPLVIMPVIKPALINEKFLQLSRYLQDDPYHLGMYERPFRLEMLVQWWRSGELDDARLAEELAWAWPDMEGDDTIDDDFIRNQMLPLFAHLGFVSDQPDLVLPDEPLEIYRGGLPNGIAWSEDVDTARWFASRWRGAEPVYSALALPENILGRFWERGEQEVVVDPRTLCNVELLEPVGEPGLMTGSDCLVRSLYVFENFRS